MSSSPSRPPMAVFLAYYNELVGTWTRKLRNRQDAEDIAQDAVLRVLEAREAPILHPRAYLHQIARNIVTDAYRRKAVDAVHLDSMDIASAEAGDPDAMLHAEDMIFALEEALQELPLKCRQVFIWQRVEGLTQAAIASRMNISKNMVEKYMIRTMRHLRARMDTPGSRRMKV